MGGEISFNLHENMTKKEVLAEAKRAGLSKKAMKEIKIFFKNDVADEDGKKRISNKNELAALNCIFDGSGKIKMPEGNTENGTSEYEYTNNNTDVYDVIQASNDNDFAARRSVYIEKKHNSGEVETTTIWDDNADGVPDSKYKTLRKPAGTHFGAYTGAQAGVTSFDRFGVKHDHGAILGGYMTNQFSQNSKLNTSIEGRLGTNIGAKAGTEFSYVCDGYGYSTEGLKFEAGASVEYVRQTKPSPFTSNFSGTVDLKYDNVINVPVPEGYDYFAAYQNTDDGGYNVYSASNYETYNGKPYVNDQSKIVHKYPEEIPPKTMESAVHPEKLTASIYAGMGYAAPDGKWEVTGGYFIGREFDRTPDITHQHNVDVNVTDHIKDELHYIYRSSNPENNRQFVTNVNNTATQNGDVYFGTTIGDTTQLTYIAERDVNISGSYSATDENRKIKKASSIDMGLYAKGKYKLSDRVTLFGEATYCQRQYDGNDQMHRKIGNENNYNVRLGAQVKLGTVKAKKK